MPTQVMEIEPVSHPPLYDANILQSSPVLALSPSFTLSFGGINFCLTPCTKDSSVSFLGMGAGGDVLLNLRSFTGNLRVSCASGPPMVGPEDDPSPEKSIDAALTSSKVSPGQQTLNFAKSNGRGTQSKEIKIRNKPKKGKNFSMSSNGSDATPTVANVSKRVPFDEIDMQRKRDMTTVQTHPHISPMVVKKRRFVAGQEAGLTGPTAFSQSSATTLHSQTIPPFDLSQQVENDTITASEPATVEGILKKTSNQASRIKDILERIHSTGSVENNKVDGSEGSADDSENDHSDDDSSVEDQGPEDFSVAASLLDYQDRPLTPRQHPPPCPRWGHTMTMLNNNRVLVYGGQTLDNSSGNAKTLSDIHVFDTVKRQWHKSFNCDDATRQWPRQWHTATYLPERQLLICFGGESIHPKTQKVTTTAKVMVLDTEIMLWYPPSVSGTVPSGRSGHTATLLSNTNELVVFGGVRGSKWLNSVSVLNTTSWVWTTPQISGSAPKPRSYHSATAVRSLTNGDDSVVMSRIVIFGGNDSLASFKSVHVLETDGNIWSWVNPTVSGEEPLPRTGHTATLLNDKKTICVYGGWDPNAEDEDEENENFKNAATSDQDEDIIFDDCFLLDTETWIWKRGPKPLPAAFIDSESQGESENTRRVGHSAMLYNNPEGGSSQVLMFGGRLPQERFAGDFKMLDVQQ